MIKKIHLIHHTHFDIGFTDLAEEVISQQLHALDQGIRYCEADPEYHWTIESGSLVRNYLKCRPQNMRERLLKLLRNGQMEAGAFDMQMLTETASFAELLANVARPVELGKKYGFPVKCAILDDIGGFAGELPRLMNEAGLRYLIAGTGAFQTELPWADLPHLFYLKSKSGGRILVWNIGNDRSESSCESNYPFPVYGLGSHFIAYHGMPEFTGCSDMGIKPLMHGENPEKRFRAKEVLQILLDRLQQENYPYEEIMLQYGGDNRAPSPHAAELVRRINATGDFPEIILTTPCHFFHQMEQKYASVIPEIQGLLTDPWNLRINAIPSSLKQYRSAQRRYDSQRIRNGKNEVLLENLMLMADHTFGLNHWGWQKLAENSPDGLQASCFDRCRTSWACKAAYAESANRMAHDLELHTESSAAQCETEAIVIRNHAEHETSGTTELYLGSYAPQLISLKNCSGKEIPRQYIGLNRWMLYAENVPAWGIRRCTPVFSDRYDVPPTPPDEKIPAALITSYFTFEFADDGTLYNIHDKNGKSYCVNSGFTMGEVFCEVLHDSGTAGENCGLKPSKQRSLMRMEGKHGRTEADGELFCTILQSGRIGNAAVEIRFRVWKQLPRIDFSIRINKPENPLKSCFYTAFPFTGKKGKFYFDQNCGTATLSELLPGAMQDLFYCSRYTALETNRFSAILCCPDAPVIEFGGLHTAQWKKNLPLEPESNFIFAMLFNNICNTDAPAWFPVLDTFEYSLFLLPEKFSTALAHQAWENATALTSKPGFAAESCMISNLPGQIRAHSDENGTLYLENTSGKECTCHILFCEKKLSLTLAPFEIRKAE